MGEESPRRRESRSELMPLISSFSNNTLPQFETYLVNSVTTEVQLLTARRLIDYTIGIIDSLHLNQAISVPIHPPEVDKPSMEILREYVLRDLRFLKEKVIPHVQENMDPVQNGFRSAPFYKQAREAFEEISSGFTEILNGGA